MAWRALVLADLQTGLSAQELTAVRTLALASGQTDPTAPVLVSTMDDVRGYIAASSNIALGAEGTIPDKLIATAVDIAIWQLISRFPTKLLATETRRQRYTDALKRLKDVASGDFRIEVPLTFTAETTGGVPLPTVTNNLGVRARVRCEENEV